MLVWPGAKDSELGAGSVQAYTATSGKQRAGGRCRIGSGNNWTEAGSAETKAGSRKQQS